MATVYIAVSFKDKAAWYAEKMEDFGLGNDVIIVIPDAPDKMPPRFAEIRLTQQPNAAPAVPAVPVTPTDEKGLAKKV